MFLRHLSNYFRIEHSLCLVILVLLGSLTYVFAATEARAQLTDEDIEALRERGKKEGWTFTVGRTSATDASGNGMSGLVKPKDWKSSSAARRMPSFFRSFLRSKPFISTSLLTAPDNYRYCSNII